MKVNGAFVHVRINGAFDETQSSVFDVMTRIVTEDFGACETRIFIERNAHIY